MTQKIETYIVDSFTDKPFSGNPAGVCVLHEPLKNEQMQSIAKELGFSETAFIHPIEAAQQYAIRYFTPKMEIPLCGHATLASAKVLFESFPNLELIYFKTIVGVDLRIKSNGKTIEMEFPVYDTVPQQVPEAMLKALGIEKIVTSAFNKEMNMLLIEIESSEVLKKLSPDFEKLKHSPTSISGVVVTSLSQQTEYDFESRYFWPWSGTNEDPVTGATHTFLSKYWSTRLHKNILKSFQCSERTGFMDVELISGTTCILKSQAQLVLKGELSI